MGLLAVVRPPVRVLEEGNLLVEQKNGKVNFHFLNLFKISFKFPQRAGS